MNHDMKVRKEVGKTMKLLDEKQECVCDPYFYTRLKARLESRKKQPLASFLRERWQFSLVVLLAALNIAAAGVFLNKEVTEAKKQRTLAYLDREYTLTPANSDILSTYTGDQK